MKITYYENPLRTTVELDDDDRAKMRLAIKMDQLEWGCVGAEFYLTKDPPNIERALGDVRYYQDEKVWDKILAESEAALLEPHCGDCTSQPAPCSKCRAEEYLGMRTFEGNKREGYYIAMAFCKGASVDKALAELKRGSGDVSQWTEAYNSALAYLQEHLRLHGFSGGSVVPMT